jgi:hypothetical protein
MYSPYLYARRSELLALRAVLKEGGNLSGLLPVIEPVLTNTGDILRCMKAFDEANHPLIVLTNPDRHEFKNGASGQQVKAFHKDCGKAFAEMDGMIPAYRVDATASIAGVDAFLNVYKARSVALVYESPSLADKDLSRLAKDGQIAYHVVLAGRITALQLRQFPSRKLIDTRDGFNKLARNADYAGKEIFTDRHRLVGKTLAAIGDHTVIGRALELGGGKPGAIALHLTYKNDQSGAIWIEHFVSDETDREVGDAASKFLEAAEKCVHASTRRRAEFGRNFALNEYASHVHSHTFPGLGKNKEHQIHHHIRLMLDVIHGDL